MKTKMKFIDRNCLHLMNQSELFVMSARPFMHVFVQYFQLIHHIYDGFDGVALSEDEKNLQIKCKIQGFEHPKITEIELISLHANYSKSSLIT